MHKKSVPYELSLASLFPEIAVEWHPTLNGDLTPQTITPGNQSKVWWLGKDCGHEWNSSISLRANRGYGCAVCAGKQILVGHNDLGSQNTELAAEWHPTKNGTVTPEMVMPGSNKKVWWLGKKCGHEWNSIITNRAKGAGCPFCNGRQTLAGFNDLASHNPGLADEWHPDKNGDLTPQMVTPGSEKAVWWLGKECGHEWEISVKQRNRAAGCPFCSGRKILAGFNDLASQNPGLAAEWHPDKNGDLTPQMVMPGSSKKVWWLGKECGHEWESSINGRKKNNCPICAGKKIVIGFNDLASQNPGLAYEWHPTKNGDLTPQMITGSSDKIVWWLGKECGHEWESSVTNRKAGWSCPICAGRKVLTGYNDLGSYNPKLVSEWHPTKNGDLTPQMVTRSSHAQVWWICASGHEWEGSINGRVKRGNVIAGCLKCFSESTTSKAEKEVSDLIETLLGKEQYVARNVRTEEGVTEIDIHIPSRQLAVEFNGIYWHSVSPSGEPEYSRIHKNYHSDKSQACKARGISLIHIWEDDYTNRRDLVMRTLARALGTEDALIKPGVLTELNLAYMEKLDVDNLEFAQLDDDYAAEFMTENSLKRHHTDEAIGEYYGLTDMNGDVRAAISVVETGSVFAPELLITGFITLGIIPGALDALISNLSEHYGANTFVFTVDPSSDDIRAIRKAGFTRMSERGEPRLYACTSSNRYDPADENKPVNAVRRLWDEGREVWELNLR